MPVPRDLDNVKRHDWDLNLGSLRKGYWSSYSRSHNPKDKFRASGTAVGSSLVCDCVQLPYQSILYDISFPRSAACSTTLQSNSSLTFASGALRLSACQQMRLEVSIGKVSYILVFQALQNPSSSLRVQLSTLQLGHEDPNLARAPKIVLELSHQGWWYSTPGLGLLSDQHWKQTLEREVDIGAVELLLDARYPHEIASDRCFCCFCRVVPT